MFVADANVVVAALRSRRGASFVLLNAMLEGSVSFAISPAVAFEYEAVLKRGGVLGPGAWLPASQVDAILDAICAAAIPALPWFQFRPFLGDPDDDLYVECALASGAETIVTNDKHFSHPVLRAFGLSSMTAREFLRHERILQ